MHQFAPTLVARQTVLLPIGCELGRCDRSESCETPAGSSPAGGLSARLHLLNGKLLNEKIASQQGALSLMIAEKQNTDAIVESFYWRALFS